MQLSFNNHKDEARRAVEQVRQLLAQQEYEQIRRLGDIKVRADELRSFVPTRVIPGEVADRFERLAGDVNRSLKAVRDGLDDAERVLNELLNTVLNLELDS